MDPDEAQGQGSSGPMRSNTRIRHLATALAAFGALTFCACDEPAAPAPAASPDMPVPGNPWPIILKGLRGMVFQDLNGNGKWDGREVGLQGATVTLVHDTTVQTDETNAYGSYYFDVDEPGLYELVWEPGHCPPSTPTHLQVLVLRWANGALSGFWDGNFGCYAVGDASISVRGRVFVDNNRNGLMESGDLPFSGAVLVGSTDCANSEPIEMRTDENGNYTLLLPPCPPLGVALRAIDGYVFTTPSSVTFDYVPPEHDILWANFGVAPVAVAPSGVGSYIDARAAQAR